MIRARATNHVGIQGAEITKVGSAIPININTNPIRRATAVGQSGIPDDGPLGLCEVQRLGPDADFTGVDRHAADCQIVGCDCDNPTLHVGHRPAEDTKNHHGMQSEAPPVSVEYLPQRWSH